MLYFAKEDNIPLIATALNKSKLDSVDRTVNILIYTTRGKDEILNIMICTRKEWVFFYRQAYETEYMLRNIDIVVDTAISKNVLKEILPYLSPLRS